MMFLILLLAMGDFSDLRRRNIRESSGIHSQAEWLPHLCMEWSKIPRNCLSDVWYMVLTMDISTMRK